jgi:DNA-binding MarR family transcriptional regulator
MARKNETTDYTPGSNLTQAYVDLQDAGNAQAQLLMKAIAQHADWKTGETICGVRSLAEIGKCSMKTVRRYLKKLQKDGLIELETRHQDGEDDNGRQTTSRITLVGYAEWAAANRNGGTVKRPMRVPKYAGSDGGSPPGQDDQGGTGTPCEQEALPPGQPDQGPLDNLSVPPGHLLSTPPGQQGDQGKNLHSNLEDNTPPQPPKRAERARGARARGNAKSGNEADQLLAPLRSEPSLAGAVALLIEPIARQRKILAPDPGYMLGKVATWAAGLPETVLKAAAHSLLEARRSAVGEEHIVAAVREQAKVAGLPPLVSRPAAPRVAADGKIDISAREHPEAFAAWMAHHEQRVRQRQPNQFTLGRVHGFVREATLFPPGHPETGARP